MAVSNMNLIRALQLRKTQTLTCGGGGCGDLLQTKIIISPKFRKVGKVGNSGEKLGKVGKSGKKWEKSGKSA